MAQIIVTREHKIYPEFTVEDKKYYPLFLDGNLLTTLGERLNQPSNSYYSRIYYSKKDIKETGKYLYLLSSIGVPINDYKSKVIKVNNLNFLESQGVYYSSRNYYNINSTILGLLTVSDIYLRRLFKCYVNELGIPDDQLRFNDFLHYLYHSNISIYVPKSILENIDPRNMSVSNIPIPVLNRRYNSGLRDAQRFKSAIFATDPSKYTLISKYAVLRHGLTLLHTEDFHTLPDLVKEFMLASNPFPLQVESSVISNQFFTPNDLKATHIEHLAETKNLGIDEVLTLMQEEAKEACMLKYNLKNPEEKHGEKGKKVFESFDEIFESNSF